MDRESPYRRAAAPSISIGWESSAEALAAVEPLVDLLRTQGVLTDRELLTVLFRPRVLAFVDAEPEAAVHVAWEIAREANRQLSKTASDARFHRAGESSPRFLLLGSAEVEARRAAGETLLAGPPSLGLTLPVVAAFVAALLALSVIIGALVAAGAYVTLASTVVGLVLAMLAARGIRERSAVAAETLMLIPIAIAIGGLSLRGEVALVGLVLAALFVSALAQRWARSAG